MKNKKFESLNDSKFKAFEKNKIQKTVQLFGGQHIYKTTYERETCTENDLWHKCSYDNGTEEYFGQDWTWVD